MSPPKTKLDSAAPPARAAEALCPEPLRGAPVSRGSWRAAPHCAPWKRRLTGHPLGPAWAHCRELARPLVARGRKGTRAFLPPGPGELRPPDPRPRVTDWAATLPPLGTVD